MKDTVGMEDQITFVLNGKPFIPDETLPKPQIEPLPTFESLQAAAQEAAKPKTHNNK